MVRFRSVWTRGTAQKRHPLPVQQGRRWNIEIILVAVLHFRLWLRFIVQWRKSHAVLGWVLTQGDWYPANRLSSRPNYNVVVLVPWISSWHSKCRTSSQWGVREYGWLFLRPFIPFFYSFYIVCHSIRAENFQPSISLWFISTWFIWSANISSSC